MLVCLDIRLLGADSLVACVTDCWRETVVEAGRLPLPEGCLEMALRSGAGLLLPGLAMEGCLETALLPDPGLLLTVAPAVNDCCLETGLYAGKVTALSA